MLERPLPHLGRNRRVHDARDGVRAEQYAIRGRGNEDSTVVQEAPGPFAAGEHADDGERGAAHLELAANRITFAEQLCDHAIADHGDASAFLNVTAVDEAAALGELQFLERRVIRIYAVNGRPRAALVPGEVVRPDFCSVPIGD